MENMHKIKRMLCDELEEYGNKKSLSVSDVEMVHKLSDTIKNIDKIEALEGGGMYSEKYRHSYGVPYHDSGYHSDNVHYRYSKDDARDHLKTKLGEMMEDANVKDREVLKECMRMLNF